MQQCKLIAGLTLVVLATAFTSPCAHAADNVQPDLMAITASGVAPRSIDLNPAAVGTPLGETCDRIGYAKFLRLRLHLDSPSAVAGLRLQIVNALGREVETVDSSQLNNGRDFWTKIISGNEYCVRATGIPQPAATLRVAEVITNQLAIRQLSVIGDEDRVPVNSVNDPQMRQAARSVILLLYQHDGVGRYCTGFMIGSRRVLTNQHCIGSNEDCSTAVVLFDYEDSALPPPEKQAHCVQLRAAEYSLDFSAFDIDTVPAGIAPVRFSAAAPAAGLSLTIIEHGGELPKQVARANCAAVVVPVLGRDTSNDFSHSCDTENGSSGAPLFNAAWEVAGLHHLGIGGPQPLLNRAVIGTAVAQRLKSLNLYP